MISGWKAKGPGHRCNSKFFSFLLRGSLPIWLICFILGTDIVHDLSMCCDPLPCQKVTTVCYLSTPCLSAGLWWLLFVHYMPICWPLVAVICPLHAYLLAFGGCYLSTPCLSAGLWWLLFVHSMPICWPLVAVICPLYAYLLAFGGWGVSPNCVPWGQSSNNPEIPNQIMAWHPPSSNHNADQNQW